MNKTKFEKGDLVWVWHSIIDDIKLPGVVIEVRPWVLGGSGVCSWRESYGGFLKSSEVTNDSKRSEYLVISPSGEFQSWFDEKNLTLEE